MVKLSIIIPSSRDPFLYNTINSMLENSVEDIEVIPVLDGYDTPDIPSDPRVKVIKLEKTKGMRGAINAGLFTASGYFVMKSDSHCLYSPGFDQILTDSCRDNWLIIPRRYSLDEFKWDRNMDRPMYDYHYLGFPTDGNYGYDMPLIACHHFTDKRNTPEFRIDDTMIFQGSSWLANREYFMEHVGFLDDREETYGTFACEPLEIGMKYWLGGGEVKVNKNTWYAHLSKRKRHYDAKIYSRNYKKGKGALVGHTWATNHWLNNEEPGMIHPFNWLVEKFWPVPGWPKDYV